MDQLALILHNKKKEPYNYNKELFNKTDKKNNNNKKNLLKQNLYFYACKIKH